MGLSKRIDGNEYYLVEWIVRLWPNTLGVLKMRRSGVSSAILVMTIIGMLLPFCSIALAGERICSSKDLVADFQTDSQANLFAHLADSGVDTEDAFATVSKLSDEDADRLLQDYMDVMGEDTEGTALVAILVLLIILYFALDANLPEA